MGTVGLVALGSFLLGLVVGRPKVVLVPLALTCVLAMLQLAGGSDGETHAIYWPVVILVLGLALSFLTGVGVLVRRLPRATRRE